MTGYDIFLSNGTLLTTINVKTIDAQQNSSLFLIGQGIPDYGTDIAQDLVWMLENFSKSTSPVHPLVGQEWFDLTHKRMNVYNGSEWVFYPTMETNFSTLFDMLPAANAFDFTTTGTTAIFTGSDSTKIYLATHVLLIPAGEFTATGAPTINMSVSSAGDVVASSQLPIIASSQFVRLTTVQEPKIISGTGTLNLNVTTAATGGQCNYTVLVYGAIVDASI